LINGRKLDKGQQIDFNLELTLPSGHYMIENQSSSAVYVEEKPRR
jgi:hypothetical protein